MQEIYYLARISSTPMSVLSLQSTILLGNEDWEPQEVELVSGNVMDLLVQHGWKKAT
jgi:hypothetical protein